MRLTAAEQKIIKREARKYFGRNARVLLFGSRTQDDAHGGDIDLYIETDMDTPDKIAEAEIGFKTDVQLAIG